MVSGQTGSGPRRGWATGLGKASLCLGGTVALVATVLETLSGEKGRWWNFQLKAEAPVGSSSWDPNWDRRAGQKVTASRNIILVRHGQYNLSGTTDAERVLTLLGRKQAATTAARLSELGLPYTHLVQSDMSRAMETASLVSAALPSVPLSPPDSLLREGAPVRPEPRSSTWRPDQQYSQDGARIEAAFRKYFHRAEPDQTADSYEVIVCHANVIRYFACRALQLPPEAWLRISLKHASLTWLVVRPDGRVSCRGLGDSGHFPPELLTTS